MKLAMCGAALLAALSLAGCGVNPANGDATLGGIDTGIPNADVQLVKKDVQAAINALPSICQKAAVGASMTASELLVIQQVGKLPAKTAANINNALAKGLIGCNGTAAVLSPVIQAPAGTPATAGN